MQLRYCRNDNMILVLIVNITNIHEEYYRKDKVITSNGRARKHRFVFQANFADDQFSFSFVCFGACFLVRFCSPNPAPPTNGGGG